MMMMTRSSSRWLATLLLLACVLATTSPRVVVAQEDDLLDRISNLIDTIDSEQGSATDLLAGSGENPVDAPDMLALPDGTSDITDNALLPDTSTTTPPPTTTTPAADDTDRPSNVNIDEDDTDDNAGGDFSDLANNIAMMVADQSGDGEDDTNSFDADDVTANRPTVDADDSADDNDGGAGGVSPDLDLDVNDILPDGDADAPEVPPTTTTDDNDSPTVPDATNNTPQDTEGNGQDTALENVDSSGDDTVADVLPEDPSDDVDSAAAIVADIIPDNNIPDLDSSDFTSDFVDMLTGSNIAADETGLTNPDFNIPSTGESDTDSDSVDANTGGVGTAEAVPQLATGQPQQQRIRYLTSGGGGGGALGFSGRNRFGAPPPRVREYPVRSLIGLFNPMGSRFISGGGAAAPLPAASGPSYDAQGCLACPEVHQVRARVHPAYNPDPECGACIDAIYLKMRYPELSLDTFNLTEFQDNLAASLGVDYSRIFIESIEEGSVIATVVILPEWIFLAPPNATDTVEAVTLAANETAAPAAEDDGRTALNGTATEEFLTAEASEPNSNATAAATIEGDEIAMSFRSATGEEEEEVEEEEEEEEEPYVEVEYSDITLARLHQLLSSHYLQGVGAFDYRVSTDSDPQHCDRFAHSKQEARDIIALSTCDGVGGDCDFVWGEEMEVGDNSTALRPQELLRGFDGGAEGATDMIYESMMMARANDTDLVSTIDNQIPLQKNSYIRLVTLALLDIGRDVELNLGRENEFLLMGGFANLSVTECQDCTCRSDVKWNQPYVEWQKLPALS